MKIIVAGSRTIVDPNILSDVLNDNPFVSLYSERHEWVSGGANGVDTLVRLWCKDNNLNFKEFPANWDGYKKAAGFIRNKEMATYGDVLIAIWDGKSKGTRHMIDCMLDQGKDVWVSVYES